MFSEFPSSTDAFLEASKHNDAHTTPSTLFSNAKLGMETRARKRNRERRDATAANAGEAIPGLNDIVVTHILKSEYFDDPADLARLPAVSHAMRDTMSGAGLRFEELSEYAAVEVGCLSAVQRLDRGGRLWNREYLCQAAARSGQLEELKVLRTDGWPWDDGTCSAAARGGHLEVLQWARSNGCPWDLWTCASAAKGGHLQVLQWLRANGCPWDEWTCEMAVEGEAEMYGLRASGHHDLFVWARENGCPMNDETRNSAGPLGWLGDDDW